MYSLWSRFYSWVITCEQKTSTFIIFLFHNSSRNSNCFYASSWVYGSSSRISSNKAFLNKELPQFKVASRWFVKHGNWIDCYGDIVSWYSHDGRAHRRVDHWTKLSSMKSSMSHSATSSSALHNLHRLSRLFDLFFYLSFSRQKTKSLQNRKRNKKCFAKLTLSKIEQNSWDMNIQKRWIQIALNSHSHVLLFLFTKCRVCWKDAFLSRSHVFLFLLTVCVIFPVVHDKLLNLEKIIVQSFCSLSFYLSSLYIFTYHLSIRSNSSEVFCNTPGQLNLYIFINKYSPR